VNGVEEGSALRQMRKEGKGRGEERRRGVRVGTRTYDGRENTKGRERHDGAVGGEWEE